MELEIKLASPLLIIGALALAAILVDAFTGKNKKPMFPFSVIGLSIAGLAAIWTMTFPSEMIDKLEPADSIARGMIIYGGYSAFFDLLFILAAIMTIFSAKPYLLKENYEQKEFYSLIIYAVAGMMLIAHTGNLLMLFIGIEIMSLSFYILAGYFRKNEKSVEAALKYFLLGAFATGFLLYGMAMIYGGSGSFELAVISAKAAAGETVSLYMTIGFGLLIIGLSFKVAAFPFHQWAPDVYHGSPTVVTAFMSTAGKAAALIGFIIVARTLMPLTVTSELTPQTIKTAQIIIAIISAATMLVGNISAVVQKNVKRMLAYSSVAHAGYMLMGIVANNQRGWSGILFYAAAYMFMQIGAFVIVSVLEKEKEDKLQLEDYAGLYKSHPVLAALMALFMFSLAGIPPMAGFFGKYYLFTAAIEAGFTWLTIVAVISTIISIYFYIGLVVYMYFREPEGEPVEAKTGSAGITLAFSGIGILILGIFPSILINLANTYF